jgi:hypothetical protein
MIPSRTLRTHLPVTPTLKLLNASDLSPEFVASNIGVTGRWVRKVRDGIIKEPGVQKIQRLHDFLSTNKSAA